MAVPIIKIPIDSAEYDRFIDSFMNYQNLLEKQGDAWAESNKGIRQQKTAFDEVDKAFDHLVKASTDQKFSSPTSGVFARIDKDSKETAKSWQNIAKEIEKAGRGLTGIARNGGMGLLGLFGAAGALAGGIYGATAGAANSVAGDFKSSRQLGLQLGKEKEFGIAGEPYGLGRDQLEEAANAKQDVTKQQAFRNAGVTDFTQDAAELAWAKARGEAQLYSQWEKTSPEFAQNQAKAWFPDENPDQLRLLADALDKGDLDKAQQQYEQNWEKVGYSQQQGEDATKFKQDQAQKWADIETAWNKDILLLAPHLDKWSSAAEHLVTGFLDNSAKTINDLANAGDNPTPPGTEPPPAAPGDYGSRITRGTAIVGQWLQEHGMPNPFNNPSTAAGQPGFTLDPSKTAHMASLESIWSMPKGLMQAEENIESSGGSNNINPTNSKVLGAFQFDQPTADEYGVDRHDEYSSEVGAARYLADLKKKYGAWDKAVAAYDGFGGLDKDIAKYGNDWRAHINEFQKSGETSRYLDKLEKQGVNLNGNPFDDPKAMKTAQIIDSQNDPRILPMDSVDAKALDAQQSNMVKSDQQVVTESMLDRLKRGFGMMGDFLSEGGGAQFAQPAAPARAASTTAQQFNIQMQVSAPAGSDVQVTGAQLAQ